jgi:glycyl-tRNA synthetase beta subunit
MQKKISSLKNSTSFCKNLHIEKPLTAFFENLIINDADKTLRKNHLLILSQISKFFEDIGNLSQIELQF